jgi:hypothetical protein
MLKWLPFEYFFHRFIGEVQFILAWSINARKWTVFLSNKKGEKLNAHPPSLFEKYFLLMIQNLLIDLTRQWSFRDEF